MKDNFRPITDREHRNIDSFKNTEIRLSNFHHGIMHPMTPSISRNKAYDNDSASNIKSKFSHLTHLVQNATRHNLLGKEKLS